jgi:squalene-associated FAD-dependent desaturase
VGNQPPAAPQKPLGTVAVLGGGLAGMSAALRLTALGYQVTLVERRPYLGGRAYSFVDRESGTQVDNGQHIFLGCCTAYTAFLDDIGTLGLTHRQQRLRIEVHSPTGIRGILSSLPLPLPAPLHLLPSFLLYPHLSWRDKLRAIPALLRIQREADRDRSDLQMMSFYDWLRRNGQSQRSIDNFWELLVIPALNDSSRNVNASAGFMLFQVALLQDRHGADVGYASQGLSEVMGTAVEQLLPIRGASLALGRSVERLQLDGDTVTSAALADGSLVQADWYVSALPPSAMLALLPQEQRNLPHWKGAAAHTWSPIVNLHVWYDCPVADFDFAAFVESPVQWVFNKTRISNLPGPGEYITVSLSAAWDYWPMSKLQMEALFLPELTRILPKARNARVERFIIVKEQRATFRSLPSSSASRLPAKTPQANLFLAGDWTDTGWASTMEGAVRSGVHAAEELHAARSST